MTPQETDPDLLVRDQESPAEAWVGGGLQQGWGHRVQQCLHWVLLKEVTIIFTTSSLVWPQVK